MTLQSEVIVLWAAQDGPEMHPLVTSSPSGLCVVRIEPETLATAVLAALARGPVVAVVSGDRQAHRALALGVDEVVRLEQVSERALTDAAESARLRAIGRDARPAGSGAEARAIELLATSVSCRLANPLAVASLNVEILRAAMDAVTGLADAYARDAAEGHELRDSEAQRVVALRASAPPTPDLHATVHDIAAALREAANAVAHVCSLVAQDSLEETCDPAAVVSEVSELVRVVVERVASFKVEIKDVGSMRVALPRAVLSQALSALLTNAVQAVREAEDQGAIVVRLEVRPATAIVEVIDNGVGMSPTMLTRAMEPLFSTSAHSAGLGLSAVAERVRKEGGEIILESEQGVGTTARIFLPLVAGTIGPNRSAN